MRQLVLIVAAMLLVGCQGEITGPNLPAPGSEPGPASEPASEPPPSESEFDEAGGCDAAYPEQEDSPYVLPAEPGVVIVVGQGNCTDGSHSGDQQFAYDFDMPIGTAVVAARSGVVLDAEGQYVDGTRTPGEENFILVEHDDGSVAGYFHLTRDGVLVDIGDVVDAGEVIGLSGDTGDSTEPHLHFEVLDVEDGDSLPVTFRNTRPHPQGLVDLETYDVEAE